MKDIENREDIQLLVKNFYENLLRFPEMQPVFSGLNFEEHLPRIVAFWSMVLLDEEGYTTNVFDKHLHLPITLPLFDLWLSTFITTVDGLFLGERAELAKQRARLLTHTFKSKWLHLGKDRA